MGKDPFLLGNESLADLLPAIGKKMNARSFARMMRTNKVLSHAFLKVRKGPQVEIEVLEKQKEGWAFVRDPYMMQSFNPGILLSNRDIKHFRFVVNRLRFPDEGRTEFFTNMASVEELINAARKKRIIMPSYVTVRELGGLNHEKVEHVQILEKLFESLGVKEVRAFNRKFVVTRGEASLGIFPLNVSINFPSAIFYREDLLALKAKTFVIDFNQIEANDLNTFLSEWKQGTRNVERGQLMRVSSLYHGEVMKDLDASVLYTKTLHGHSILQQFPKSRLPIQISRSKFYILQRTHAIHQKLVVVFEHNNIIVRSVSSPYEAFNDRLEPDQYKMLSE